MIVNIFLLFFDNSLKTNASEAPEAFQLFFYIALNKLRPRAHFIHEKYGYLPHSTHYRLIQPVSKCIRYVGT